MAVVTDQNGRRTVGKTNCGNEELAFLASAIQEGRPIRRERLQMQLPLKSRRRFFNLVCYLLLLIYITVPLSFHFCRRFLQDSFFFLLSQKHATRYATELPAFQPATLSSFLNTEHRIQMWFMHIKQIYFVHQKQE